MIFLLMLVIGFFLLIVPGLYVLTTYSFFGYALVDRKGTLKEAFSHSAAIAKGHKIRLLGFFIVQAMAYVVGLLVVYIGVYVANAVSSLAFARLYRDLAGQGQHR